MRSLFRTSTALLVAGLAACATAAEPKIAPLITGLNNPCGVAIQPSSGDLFVSDSGAGRVIRYNPASGGKATAAITDFGQDIYGKGPMYDIGPLGLLFLDKDTLAVGGGEHKDGSEILSIFAVPAAGKMVKADAAKYKLGPIAPGEQSQMGEGNFYGLAADKNAIYITSNGDDTKGWILRADISGDKPGELKPFIATKVALEDTDAPVGICLSKEGDLVVGQMGEVNKPGDSLLTTYDAKSGKLKMRAATGLHDIAALAYSPSGKLYAVDFAWIDAKQGGLFRLDVTKDNGSASVKAVKITSLDKPTAIVFDANGAAYVTVFGTAAEGSNKPAGQLLKITGDL
jgi:DNA-binding beta-propeller fold protein YncE